jgi:hypothetical protein
LPEPPALDPGKIGLAPITSLAGPSVSLVGSKGAAPANCVIRVTNLDSTADAIAKTADASGAFSLDVVGVASGNELRFQALLGSERSAPIDFVYTGPASPTLTPSSRHDCVTLSPGFELVFEVPGARNLTLVNACPNTLGISNPRQRQGLAAFALTSSLPLDVPAASDAALSIEFTAATGKGQEDILFLDLSSQAGVLRYPVTLYAP